MTIPVGYARLALDEVTSTLDEAQARAAELTGPTWITATRQTSPRGRRGRAWSEPEGNFAATLALPLQTTPAAAAQRSFVTALALFDTCVALSGRREAFALKWPNDVLLNGGKLAGILLETLRAGPAARGIAIGIGVNLAHAPDPGRLEVRAVRPVCLAHETGALVGPGEFLAALAPAFAHREAQMQNLGFAPIRAAWLTRAARLGDTITARLPRETITGRFDDVDEQGQLVLSTPEGQRRIAAAEVFF